jgi:hypothetical protein
MRALRERTSKGRASLRVRTALALVAMGAALAACGGGGSSSGPAAAAAAPATEGAVPVQASASVAGLIAWASTVPRSDTAEPVDTDAFHPPVDDSAEPTAVQ